MKIRPEKGLTFDDVLLVPARSSVSSRQDIELSTHLTRKIKVKIPIVSSNMDTVTEQSMAIAMAKNGGIGIIHRFMTIEDQIEQIKNVKRYQGFIVENPHEILKNQSIDLARRKMKKVNVGGLVVRDEDHNFVGLVTARDLLLSPKSKNFIFEVMTPIEKLIFAKPDITPEKAKEILYENRIEKLPVIDGQGNLVGLITAQDVVKPDLFPSATMDAKGRLMVGGAIGVTKGEMERATAIVEAGADVIVLDIAHGHADHCLDMLKQLKNRFDNVQVIAGNVATKEGTIDLINAGADGVKVGIGPGSICTTRIVTGFGVPQLSAIMDCRQGVIQTKKEIPLIADGGIKTSGDLVKALAAGASSVMIGSLLAGTDEAPGMAVIRNGQKVKVIRGMASLGATMERKAIERGIDESAEDQEDWEKVVPEGVEAVVPFRGRVIEVLDQLTGGLRSGISYGGGKNILEMQEKAEFIQITPAGIKESHSHDIEEY